MNSYPPELLAQLAPVMFVAGLDVPPSPPPAKGNDFGLLTHRLREALQAQRKVAIWQPEKAKTFQIIIVDKEVRFPPRKLVAPDDPQYSAAHSPLSPLTPTSPLYPDGLIAPIWIRKHTTLVPSVFVLFLRIFEFPPHNAHSPLDPPDTHREREKEQEERRRDTELAAEVALRKKSTNERGIKLTVVLMASRKMLDDPTLDARLTYIRRQSGLDSRAALFVLSPVSPGELGEFVKSLQQALYEPALEYYTAHSKRVRRKRNRHSQAVSYPNPPPGMPNIARPLRPEGWTVRYEYKMACFAEFRGEDEVALKHYQDAHSMLVVMFGSTAILPPRTKRWAEAKVLADCINVKIAKLYLYNNEHALALSHHNTHVRIFSDFSRGWGIGEETFEYWSWIARQNRIFAELLDQGTRSTLKIPIHKPAPATTSNAAYVQNLNNPRGSGAAGATEVDSLRLLGINPSHALQHPGFYYYMAAKCTEMRRERFLAALEMEQSQKLVVSSPGFANEKKVDHLTIILELYTKAYELFKKYTPQSPSQSRLTLWIAYRIAQTYYDSGKFDMAIRFFERIAKTYRREKWGSMLRPLLATWYACARELGDVDLSVKLLIEMLGHDVGETEDPTSVEEDLLAILKSTVPSSDDVLVVDLTESQPIFDSNVVFWASEVKVGEPAAFQFSVAAPANIPMSSLPFSSLTLYFSHSDYPLVVRHQDAEEAYPSPLLQRVDLGHITSSEFSQEITADLRWPLGGCIVFSGTMASDVPITLKVSKVLLTITEGTWKVDVPFNPCGFRRGLPPTSRWLSSLDPPRYIPVKREESSSVNVIHRPHSLAVSLSHCSPAYLNEDYPITIDITNMDDRDLDVVVDVLLPPTEIDDAVNTIVLGDETSSNFIKGVFFGSLAPGVSVVKTLHLTNTGAAGDRVVDISIQSRTLGSAADPENFELHDTTETLRTVVVSTVEPLKVTQTIVYRQGLGEWPGLADLRTFDGDFWDHNQAGEAVVNTRIECVGPFALEVESIRLERQEHERAKILECSADDITDDLPSEYHAGDELAHVCLVALGSSEDSDEEAIASPGEYLISWRRIGSNGELGPLSTSVISLPPLKPPVEGLLALLSVPPAAVLHVPISLTLTIRNYHPSRSANITVQLELDASDGFVVAGLRSGRIPILLPGTEEKLTWRLIPIECGQVRLPRIKVTDRRPDGAEQRPDAEAKGNSVKIVDVRLDQAQPPDGVDALQGAPHSEQEMLGTVLVLP
ncbi:Trafficking protein particle complex subunit 11 [Hypsizygus marmoreus]|uniref:Trafficking protein particle complex subunit 11 n=1 Tax=Hypsizygus marmoreus TaxID=39966 RepID=A0A369JRJ1_HYPMA|nr:Trafficking protein particle complex subunit 11 [Hypsizygus marmoreus]